MTSTGRRGYVTADRRWLADERLTDSGLRLMLWLDSHSDEYLTALHVKRTAEEIGWSRDRVTRTLTGLEELGLITTAENWFYTLKAGKCLLNYALVEWLPTPPPCCTKLPR